MEISLTTSPPPTNLDEWLFGWDATVGIVSVWADRTGRALIWRRQGDQVVCEKASYQPWVFARTLADVSLLKGIEPIHFHILTGGANGDFRYLITASDFRTLERTIIAGAAQRLGKPVKRLSQLEDYHSVGAIEQYLMQTGRVYFRGLTYHDLWRLQFDLATTTLNPQTGRIFLAAVRDSRGFETVLEAPNPNDEAQLIHDLCTLIQQRDPDVIENHNLFGFDLPFLEARAQTLGVTLALGRSEGQVGLVREDLPNGYHHRARHHYSVAGRELIDTLVAVLRSDATNRSMPDYGLRSAARHFSIPSSQRTPIHGHHIHDRYGADAERVRRYALDNVREVDALSQLLMGASFALAGMAPRPFSRVASAGPAMGLLEPMLVRAYHHAHTALPRSKDLNNVERKLHQGGASYLLAGGIARHVVKADVASMYPTIMRTYQIGPQYDRLGVFVGLIGRLVELRLGQKAAGRIATAGSTAANEHKAQAAGMKLMINAAYGYLGAGAMGLFADVEAAEEITAHGRAILDQLIAELQRRGMALLEADTDGVYFATPENWGEHDERRLVAEVAATLPTGIRLEYEGRYEAMLSHEIRNYALLTYSGKVILKGGGLHNSQSPPFASRFLSDALEYLLRGDVSGLVALYQATVAALRLHKFALVDVATRARLTKTPHQYQLTRRLLREAPYEAIMDVGRKTWEVGEKVRFYRAKGGRCIWLPFAAEEIGDAEVGDSGAAPPASAVGQVNQDRREYDVAYYIRLLHDSYLSRLRKAFSEADFERLFRRDTQLGLYDRPIAQVEPLWIMVPGAE